MWKFSIYVFFLLILSGCGAGYRARLLLNQAEEDLERAENFEASEYTPYELSEGKMRILSGRMLLEKKRDKEALTEAQRAKTMADNALRLSLKSAAAISVKKARDMRDLVEENRAFRENADLYQRMLSEIKSAENSFVADRFEGSIRFSERAVTHGGILLDPLKKEAEIIRDRIANARKDAGSETGQSREVDALIMEGEDAFGLQQYGKAVSLWEKAEDQLRSMEKK
jgi:hypothetical protein